VNGLSPDGVRPNERRSEASQSAPKTHSCNLAVLRTTLDEIGEIPRRPSFVLGHFEFASGAYSLAATGTFRYSW